MKKARWPNWPLGFRFTQTKFPPGNAICLYTENGVLLNTTEVSIPALGRRDLDGGHSNPGPNQFGLNEIVPEDPTAPYVAQLIRYGTNSQGGYDFAFPLVATSNNAQSTLVPVTTRFG